MKINIEDLAIFGGEPVFEAPLHVGRPNIGDRDRLLERIHNVLDRRWLTNDGPYAKEFEERVCGLLGVRHCIVTASGTQGLAMAAMAAGLKGEVIVPSFTFVATAHALQWSGIRPVFADIDPRTHNLDPESVERCITASTTGIVGVHVWGRPCPVESLEKIASSHHLRLIFDAAHAFGCTYQGCKIGNFGDAEVFSFHATKFVNSLEGGAITTNDGELARRLRAIKNFGFTGYDTVDCLGTNGKMNELEAAMGLTSLESMEDFVRVNRRNYDSYRWELSGVPGVQVTAYDENEQCNYQYLVLEVDESVTRVSRDQLVDILFAENVLARRYFYPGCHQMQPYASRRQHLRHPLLHTETLVRRTLLLPTGTTIDLSRIREICQLIRLSVENGEEIVARWPELEASPALLISRTRPAALPRWKEVKVATA